MFSLKNIGHLLFNPGATKKRSLPLIIIIHLLAWGLFFLLPLFFFRVRFISNNFFYRELASKLLPVGLFYFNYYFLLPKFFEKGKFLKYLSLVLVCIILIIFQDILVRKYYEAGRPAYSMQFFSSFSKEKAGTDLPEFKNRPPAFIQSPPPPFNEKKIFGIPAGLLQMSVNRSLSASLTLLFLSGFIRLGTSYLKSQNEKKALENANLNAELNFLRSQINPHFLFNTLNSIYSQAHDKSEKTEFSILKLSELLRYVLYESSSEKVELEKDIQYINNYIELQRMRLSPKIIIDYHVTGFTSGKMIAPLLLFSFIENAFKHGVSYSYPSPIRIEIGIFQKTLTLLVSNPVTEKNTFTGGGLGLKNVKRRLDLIYPDRYALDIINNDHLHIVNLKINLESD